MINSSSITNRCSYSSENVWSGMTTLIISTEEMNDIMKIVKLLEESGLLIKVVSQTIKNEPKEQKGRFLSTLVGTLKQKRTY